MISNYKIDHSSKKQPDTLLIKTSGGLNTWRVFFDIVEDEEARETVTYTVTETKIITVLEPDEEGEGMHYVDHEETSEREVTETISSFEAKYIDITLPKDETPNPVEAIRDVMLKEIDAYDVSEAVNSFILNDNPVWLDKSTRVGLVNSTTCQINAGMKETVLWLGTTPIKIECDKALQLLGALEIYALDCYNKTAEHKKNVMGLETLEDIIAYDYTAGYPEKLNMTL